MTEKDCEASLHTLRSIARSLEDRRSGHEIETARYNLYAALQAGETVRAQDWLWALRVAVSAYVTEPVHRAAAVQAIERIESTFKD